jgi:hypothetical protein
MANLPKPLLGVLVAAVAFFALWTVALKPSPSSGPVSGSRSASAAATPPKPATATASHAAAASASHASPLKTKPAIQSPAKHPAAAAHRVNVVENALNRHKVLAVLFFNPAAADDKAVKRELDAVPSFRGEVVKLAVPLSELARYRVITNQVQVTESPTLVLIDSTRKADMLTGFVDQFALAQRVSDALAVK